MIAISQPTFFPWIGYFDIIDQVELFIILDDVDFSKQSWQQRNRFKTSSKLEWFTVPVKNLSNKKINEVEILNHERLLKKFKSFIQTNYSKSNYYDLYAEGIIDIFHQALAKNNLAVLNTKIIEFFLNIFQIKTKIQISSNLNIDKKRSNKIVEICEKFKINTYLSSYGAKDYLEKDKNIFIEKKINVFLHNYEHPTYNQLYPPFKPFASTLDLLFCEGKKSFDIIKKGRKGNFLLY